MTGTSPTNPSRTAGLSRRGFIGVSLGVGVGLGAGTVLATSAQAAGPWGNPTIGRITSGFRTPSRPTHTGTDVANSRGTPIHAANAGTVVGVRTGSYPGDPRTGLLPGRTGNAVLIDHGGGYRTYYGHLRTAGVSVGQRVGVGTRVATMGATGNATGPHLHFEILVNGTPTDPQRFLAARGITLGSTPPGGSGWPTVRQGHRSQRVRVVQHLLNHRGHNLVVDGYFGPVSVAAAKAFQRSRGLYVDGVVGPLTWPKLIVSRSQGDRGSAVRGVQVALNMHGAGLRVDGDFGTITASATRSFQSSRGLVVDGLVGPITWSHLV